ncbi:unnamed protein product, partial [Rotaria magnacalcarata]
MAIYFFGSGDSVEDKEDEDDEGVNNEQSDSVNGIELTAGASADSATAA